jgi:integrase/recombinase XerD
MLFCGLRRNEVINLKLYDLKIPQEQIHIFGKGNKERIVPIPKDLIPTINKYISLERPEKSCEYLFVILKGQHRGNRMTIWGIRETFRYHRKISGIHNANPHRFRHTFGADMVKAGISLPSLMKLMGHEYIQTTMRYVYISAQDVHEEFQKVVKKLQNKGVINESNF